MAHAFISVNYEIAEQPPHGEKTGEDKQKLHI